MIQEDNVMYVREKCVFGNDVYYPACSVSQNLANVLGTKQITDVAISIAKQVFNYEVKLKTSLKERLWAF